MITTAEVLVMMSDEQVAYEAERLAKLQNPPYLREPCSCGVGTITIPDANAKGPVVKLCRLCDGRLYTWTVAPGMNGPRLSDRKLVERFGTTT